MDPFTDASPQRAGRTSGRGAGRGGADGSKGNMRTSPPPLPSARGHRCGPGSVGWEGPEGSGVGGQDQPEKHRTLGDRDAVEVSSGDLHPPSPHARSRHPQRGRGGGGVGHEIWPDDGRYDGR